MHKLSIVIALLISLQALAQHGVAVEQSFYYSKELGLLAVPVAAFKHKKGWHAEARYNYEDFKTISLHAGKTFSKEGKLAYTITPLVGGLLGNTKGLSLGANIELNLKKWNWLTQTQCVFSSDDFLYTWSELFYAPSEWFYFGAALQHTKLTLEPHLWEPGIGVGFSVKNFSFTAYDFVATPTKQHTFVLSLIFEKN